MFISLKIAERDPEWKQAMDNLTVEKLDPLPKEVKKELEEADRRLARMGPPKRPLRRQAKTAEAPSSKTTSTTN